MIIYFGRCGIRNVRYGIYKIKEDTCMLILMFKLKIKIFGIIMGKNIWNWG